MPNEEIEKFIRDCENVRGHENKKYNLYTGEVKSKQFAYIMGMDRVLNELKKRYLIYQNGNDTPLHN